MSGVGNEGLQDDSYLQYVVSLIDCEGDNLCKLDENDCKTYLRLFFSPYLTSTW